MRALSVAVQLILVLSDGWNAPRGELHRYERQSGAWNEVGAPIEVALGKEGLAWGRGLHPAPPAGEPQKREGAPALIAWMKQPLLVQLPRPVYQRVRAAWHLP